MSKNLLLSLMFVSINFHTIQYSALGQDKIFNNGNDVTKKDSNNLDVFGDPIGNLSEQSAYDNQEVASNLINIIAINKITAKIENISLKPKEFKYFGNIKITVYDCYKIPTTYDVKHQALIGIVEDKIDEDSEILFQGWMFSPDISLSTFEHPVYEVFLQSCS